MDGQTNPLIEASPLHLPDMLEPVEVLDRKPGPKDTESSFSAAKDEKEMKTFLLV